METSRLPNTIYHNDSIRVLKGVGDIAASQLVHFCIDLVQDLITTPQGDLAAIGSLPSNDGGIQNIGKIRELCNAAIDKDVPLNKDY